jgi:hypothetical protein
MKILRVNLSLFIRFMLGFKLILSEWEAWEAPRLIPHFDGFRTSPLINLKRSEDGFVSLLRRLRT